MEIRLLNLQSTSIITSIHTFYKEFIFGLKKHLYLLRCMQTHDLKTCHPISDEHQAHLGRTPRWVTLECSHSMRSPKAPHMKCFIPYGFLKNPKLKVKFILIHSLCKHLQNAQLSPAVKVWWVYIEEPNRNGMYVSFKCKEIDLSQNIAFFWN